MTEPKDPEIRFSLEDTIRILESTPHTLEALFIDLPEEWTHADEGQDTWSPFDILGHLVHGEETDWMVRARIILAREPDILFEKFDRFAQFERYDNSTVGELLGRFRDLRGANVERLRRWRLTEEQLALPGRHPELGPVTLRQLLATWAVHDLSHVAQISRVMAKRYTRDVGPWREFLPILDR